MRLDEEVDGVVDGLTDQGRAKAQRDAVHGAKAQAHCGDASDHGTGHGQHRHAQGGDGAEGEQEQAAHQQRAGDGEKAHFGFDLRAAVDGELGRAAEQQVQACARNRFELLVDEGERRFLRVDVGPCGARLHHEQRALAIARCPQAIDQSRPIAGQSGLGDALRLARGVALEQGLDRRARRCAEQ